MLAQLCARVAASSRTRPWSALLLSVVAALLLAAGALGVPVDLAFTSLWNPDDPLVARYEQVYSELRLSGRLALLLTGPEEALDAAALALVQPLRAHPAVTAVVPGPPRDWLRAQAPWLVDRALFDDWVAVAANAPGAPEAEAVRERLEQAARITQDPPGVRLVEVHLNEDPLSAAMGRSSFFAIDALTTAVLDPLGVRGEYVGFPAVAAQDQLRTNHNVLVMSPLGLLLVLLVFRFVERRPARVAVIALPLALSVLATLGVVGQLVGELTMVVAFFGVLVFGLGIDFALHLMIRLREERARGAALPEAIDLTFAMAGPPIVVGACTTAGAFFLLLLADEPAARHLGLAGGTGLLLCLALMFVTLPACWTLLERAGPEGASDPQDLPVAWISSLARSACASPRAVLAGAAALLLLAACGFPRARYETDLRRVFNRDVPALDAADRLQRLYDRNTGPWITAVSTLPELREVAARFEADPFFPQVLSAAALFPDDAAERAARMAQIAPDLLGRLRVLSAAAAFVSAPGRASLDATRALIEPLQAATAHGPPTPDTLPPELSAVLRAPNGSWLVFAYSDRPTTDAARAREERLAAWSIDPRAVGLGLAIEATMAGDRRWVTTVVLATLALVGLLMALDLRSVRRVTLALLPVLFGTTVTAGLLSLVGVGFTPLTIVAVPLLLGLGVDDGIYVVHRLAESARESTAAATAAVGRAILMTTLTSCAGVAALLFSNHPGMEGMALVLLVGLPLCLLASITLLPALATLWAE